MELITGVIALDSTATRIIVIAQDYSSPERNCRTARYEARFLYPLGSTKPNIDLLDLVSKQKQVICVHAPDNLFNGVLILGIA